MQGAYSREPATGGESGEAQGRHSAWSSNTVLVALLTNGALSKVDANRVAMRAHDGMARAVRPAHTSYDGDTIFCLASGNVEADIDLVAEMGAEVTATSIRRSVTVSTQA